jgi:hypothetical protein
MTEPHIDHEKITRRIHKELKREATAKGLFLPFLKKEKMVFRFYPSGDNFLIIKNIRKQITSFDLILREDLERALVSILECGFSDSEIKYFDFFVEDNKVIYIKIKINVTYE